MCNCTGNCNCDCKNVPITIPKGDPGAPGNPGVDGNDGYYGGYSSDWIFSASTGSGTGATEFRFNNSTLSAVTKLYINDLNGDSTDLSTFLGDMSNSGDFGRIRIFKELDSNTFWMGEVTGVTDNGSEYEIDVTHVNSNGSFVATDPVVVSFVANGSAGAAGSNGTDGINGTSVLVNNTLSESVNSALPSIALIGTKTFTLPANTLESDGDKVKITACLRKIADEFAEVQVLINGNWYTSTGPGRIDFFEGQSRLEVEMVVSRKDANNAHITIRAFQSTAITFMLGKGSIYNYENSANIGVIDFGTDTCVVEVHGGVVGGAPIFCEQLTIEKLAI